MPNVPKLPDVPPLNSYSASASLTLLAVDAINLLTGIFGPIRWGIFTSSVPGNPLNLATPTSFLPPGFPVVFADSVVSVDFRQEWLLANYPLEQGAFETYDKVKVPFEARVRFASGGSLFDRQLLLDSVNAIAGDLNLYDVVSPEFTYFSVNVSHYDYRRESRNGVGLLSVDVWLRQIRVTAAPSFSNTQAPSGANPNSNGQAQPQAASTAQAAKIAGLQ